MSYFFFVIVFCFVLPVFAMKKEEAVEREEKQACKKAGINFLTQSHKPTNSSNQISKKPCKKKRNKKKQSYPIVSDDELEHAMLNSEQWEKDTDGPYSW